VKISVFIIILLTLVLSTTLASASTWEVEFRHGEGESDTIDETDELESDYSFSTNTFKIRRTFPPLWEYSLTLSQGIRDYDEDEEEDELDNVSFSVKNKLTRKEETDTGITSLSFNIDHLNKNYDNKEEYSYNQTKLGVSTWYKLKNDYKIEFSSSFEDFLYQSSTKEAENVYNAKIGFEKYYWDNDLTFDGYTKIVNSSRQTFGTHITNKTGMSLKIHQPHLSMFRCSARAGFRNSRLNDEFIDDDVSYDYHFSEIKIATTHPLNDQIEARPHLTSFSKQYEGNSYDNAGYETGLTVKYSPTSRFSTSLSYGYRAKEYSSMTSLSHTKDVFSVSATYRERGNWGITGKFTKAFYVFADADEKDELDSIISMELNKYFSDDLNVSLSGRYKFKDYEEKADISQSRWTLGAAYRF